MLGSLALLSGDVVAESFVCQISVLPTRGGGAGVPWDGVRHAVPFGMPLATPRGGLITHQPPLSQLFLGKLSFELKKITTVLFLSLWGD